MQEQRARRQQRAMSIRMVKEKNGLRTQNLRFFFGQTVTALLREGTVDLCPIKDNAYTIPIFFQKRQFLHTGEIWRKQDIQLNKKGFSLWGQTQHRFAGIGTCYSVLFFDTGGLSINPIKNMGDDCCHKGIFSTVCAPRLIGIIEGCLSVKKGKAHGQRLRIRPKNNLLIPSIQAKKAFRPKRPFEDKHLLFLHKERTEALQLQTVLCCLLKECMGRRVRICIHLCIHTSPKKQDSYCKRRKKRTRSHFQNSHAFCSLSIVCRFSS